MTVERRRFTDEQVAEIMRLLKGSDSVELKATIPSSEARVAIRNLGFDPVEAEPRQVYFFDTPDLALNAAGVVVRARRIQGGRGDTVVKLRPVTPTDLPADVRSDAAFNVEVDVLPGGFVCSASFKGKASNDQISEATSGAELLSSIFSKQQRAFYRAHAPAGIELDSLTTLGPTFALKARHEPEEFGRRLVGEMWLYPDGERIFELSTKCLPKEAFQVGAEARNFLASRGVRAGDEQQTKTKTALEYFAAELAASAST